MKKLLSLLFSLLCCISLRADIINGDSDPFGVPRNLSINKLFAGYDYGHLLTTTVRNHILINVSGDNLRTFTATSRLVLHNTTLELDGTYTVTHGSIDVVGDVKILGFGNKFRLENAALFIASGSSLTIGDGVNFEFAPTSSWARTVFFEDASSELVLEDSTLTVSNGLGMHLTYGNLRIKGESTITNVRTDFTRTLTNQALFLGIGLVEEDDCKLIIESGARLKVRNGGIVYRNAGTSSFDDSNGGGILEVLEGGSFLFEESSDFGSSGLTINDVTLSGLEGEGNIHTLVESVLTSTGTGDPTADNIVSLAWSPDGQYAAATYNGLLGVFRFDGASLIPVTTVGAATGGGVAWTHDGKYIITGGNPSNVFFFYAKTQLILMTQQLTGSNFLYPEVSPDGRFVSYFNNTGKLYRFLGSSFRAAGATVDTNQFRVSWAPSGRTFATVDNNGPDHLNLYNFNGIASLVKKAGYGLGTTGIRIVNWGSGALLAVGSQGGDSKIRIHKYDGSGLSAISSTDYGSSVGIFDFAWSPDGKALAAARAADADALNMVSIGDGGTITRQNTDLGSSSIVLGSDVNWLDWHPGKDVVLVGRDGNAFVDPTLTPSHHLRVYNVKGTKLKKKSTLSNVTLNLEKDTTIKDLELNIG